MKISNENRQAKLLSSFDVLRSDFAKNKNTLTDIIRQMAKIDFETSLEMWKDLIDENKDVLYTSSDLCYPIISSLCNVVGDAKVYHTIANDEYLRIAIFKYSQCLYFHPLYAIEFFVKSNDLQTANTLLELAFSNRRCCTTKFEIMDGIIPDPNHGIEISDETFSFLTEWIKRVPNRDDQIKLEVKMLNYLEVDSDDSE